MGSRAKQECLKDRESKRQIVGNEKREKEGESEKRENLKRGRADEGDRMSRVRETQGTVCVRLEAILDNNTFPHLVTKNTFLTSSP